MYTRSALALVFITFLPSADAQTVETVPLSIVASFAADRPVRIQLDPDGDKVFVNLRGDLFSGEDDQTLVFDRDPGTGALVPAGILEDDEHLGTLAFSPDGRTAYSLRQVNNDHDYVDVFDRDPETGALALRRRVVPEFTFIIDSAHTATISPDQRFLYVAVYHTFPFDGFGGHVSVIPLEPGSGVPQFDSFEVRTHELGHVTSFHLLADGEHVVIGEYRRGVISPSPDRGAVSVYRRDTETGELSPVTMVSRREMAPLQDVAVTPNERFFFAARDGFGGQSTTGDGIFVIEHEPGTHTLTVIDQYLTDRFPALANPRALEVSSNGRFLFVITEQGTAVLAIHANGGLTPAGVFDQGELATGLDPLLVVPGGRVYVGKDDSFDVLSIDCSPGTETLCLRSEYRFRVEVDWTAFDGRRGRGRLVPNGSSDRSGLFYFFRQDNWEMLAKVIDGCSNNGHFWVFGAATTNIAYTLRVTDTWAGTTTTYTNPLGTDSPAITDTRALATCAAPPLPGSQVDDMARIPTLAEIETPPSRMTTGEPGSCNDSDEALCLVEGRFRVEVDWRDHADRMGRGQRVPIPANDSGLFSFFNDANWEMLVKMVDGCALNGHFWLFGAASTDVEYELRVTDTMTGEARAYTNALGSASPAIIDTQAFGACP